MESAVGPRPYLTMVKYFQGIISETSRKDGKLPRAVNACGCGGSSNAIGAFAYYIEEKDVRFIGLVPAEAPSLTEGVPAIIHGFKCLTLLDENGNSQPDYSIAAGIDCPGVGPEHSFLKTSSRGGMSCLPDKRL